MTDSEDADVPLYFVFLVVLVSCAAGFAAGFLCGEWSVEQRDRTEVARQQVYAAHAKDIAAMREAEDRLDRLKTAQINFIRTLEEEK